MKLRIKDNAVRFRITLKELDELKETERVEKETWTLAKNSEPIAFQYALSIHSNIAESQLILEPFKMDAQLSLEDFKILCSDKEEGVYILREFKSKEGKDIRFMFFVEKDRPGSACEKPEEWVYEERLGERPVTKKINE